MNHATTLEKTLRVELLDLWHAGSGRGQGRALDAVALVDADGLPYLPGRQLKGLLRDALRCLEGWGHVAAGTVSRVFGDEIDAEPDDLRTRRSQPGQIAVSSAVMSAAESAWLRSEDGRAGIPHLFVEVFSTAIDDNGVASDYTLRGVQMVVPMTLQADLQLQATDAQQAVLDIKALEQAAQLVQQVGAHRSRGAGRARLSLEARP